MRKLTKSSYCYNVIVSSNILWFIKAFKGEKRRTLFRENDNPRLYTVLRLIKLELQMGKVTFSYKREWTRLAMQIGWAAGCQNNHAPCLFPHCLLWSAIKNSNYCCVEHCLPNSNCKLCSECPRRTHKGHPEDAAKLLSIVMKMWFDNRMNLLSNLQAKAEGKVL